MTQPALAIPTPPVLSHRRALFLITLLTLPLLLLHLGTGDPVDMMELFNLIPVREAFRDGIGGGHWLMPTLNGEPRLEKPPLPVWIPAALASLFHSENLWLLRLPSILMALFTSFATYGLGCTLFKNPADPSPRHRHRQYALLAALFLPTMLMFNREARLATYDIYATAFLTAGAFFLIKRAEPDDGPSADNQKSKIENRKSLLLATAAGLSTGLSILSKGPVPAATVMLPLGLWLLLYHRRLKLFAFIALAALISICTFMPWLIAIGGIPGLIPARYPDAWPTWSSEFIQFGTGNAASINAGTKAQLTEPKAYYLQIFFWVVPLTPTFIAALLLPFLKSQSDPQAAPLERRGRILLWLLLILGLLLLTIPSEKKPRYALQLFPYAALLCAAVWQEFARHPSNTSTLPASSNAGILPAPANHSQLDPPAKILLAAQTLFFLIPALLGIFAALTVALIGTFPQWPIVADSLHAAGLIPTALLCTALLILSLILWQNFARRDFTRALRTLALSACLFIFTTQLLYKSLPSTHTNPVRVPVQQALASLSTQSSVLSTLYTFPGAQPWLATLYFSNQILTSIDPDQLIVRIKDHPTEDFYLLLITGYWNKATNQFDPTPAVTAQLAQIDSAIARPHEILAQWSDEDRQTSLIRYRSAPPGTRPE